MKRSSLLLACFIILSCKKSQHAPTPTSPTVYIAGDNGNNPVLWRNGVAQVLDDSAGYAIQVVLSGTDVYVAGAVFHLSNTMGQEPVGEYAYWKNGVKTDVSGGSLDFPCAMGVSGSNIYFSGNVFFENGVITPLPGMGGVGGISAIVTQGNDIYAAGHDSVGDAVYWKNGVMNVVTKGYYPTYNHGTDPHVACMAVSGNDVYIGGTDTLDQAAIWKNGVETVLRASSGFTSVVWSIFIDGADVYAAANIVVNGTNAPAYWKNGVQVSLPLNGAAYGNATNIFVAGNDVYAAGSTPQGAVYWKNGVETVLSSKGSANWISVQ